MIAWFVILLDTYAYYFINVALLSFNVAAPTVLGIIYGILLIVVLYFGFLSTKSDPSDPTIRAEKEARE